MIYFGLRLYDCVVLDFALFELFNIEYTNDAYEFMLCFDALFKTACMLYR